MISRQLAGAILAITAVSCAADPSAGDDAGDSFTGGDGKADGISLTEPEVVAVLSLADTLSDAELRTAGVGKTATLGIVSYRAGLDGQAGTQDNRTFDSLAELDAIPYVGPLTLEHLMDYAQSSGKIDSGAPARHDVSVLVPLPPAGEDLPWTAATPALGGALLPRAVFDKIGRSVFKEIPEASEYDALRVVGVRFDPCFTTSLMATCQPQIRLVFQTLAVNEMGVTTGSTNDGAIHALYNLTAAQQATVAEGLRALVALAPQNREYGPLGVSPALTAQGMTGAYAEGLAKLITDNAGSNLARMTFVTRTQSRQGQWELGGFHVQANATTGFPAPGEISVLGATLQVVGNGAFGASFYYSSIPEIGDPAGRPGLYAMGIAALDAQTRAAVAAWAAAQNSPVANVPDTTDCASCHVAGHVGRAIAAVDPKLADLGGPRVITPADGFGDNLRAFGYFGKDAHVSARTANETAAVVRALATAR